MRVSVDGSHDADRLLDGLINPAGAFKWSGFIREPVVSPDGRYVAIATDLPDPTSSDVIAQAVRPRRRTRSATSSSTRSRRWVTRIRRGSPTAARLLYVRNDRDGAKGTPRI